MRILITAKLNGLQAECDCITHLIGCTCLQLEGLHILGSCLQISLHKGGQVLATRHDDSGHEGGVVVIDQDIGSRVAQLLIGHGLDGNLILGVFLLHKSERAAIDNAVIDYGYRVGRVIDDIDIDQITTGAIDHWPRHDGVGSIGAVLSGKA